MNKVCRLSFLLLMCLCFSSAYGKTTVVDAKTTQLFQHAVTHPSVPGISVAIADKSGVIWAKGFGYADLENQVAMTPKHKMRIGSVAKVITTAGLMRLVENKSIDVDAKIGRYVENLPQTKQPITLRQLASHSSGIRHYNDQAEFLLNQRFDTVTSSLSLFIDDPLLFTPGTRYQYSTFAFSLMAAAMEGATQRSFKHIIEDEVLAPLNMSETAFDDSAAIIPLRQRPYVWQEGELRNAPQSDHSYKYAGGGFIASPADISRFAVAHTTGDYLSKDSQRALFTRATLIDKTPLPYGIGWMIDFDNFKDRKYYLDNAKAQRQMASFDHAVMHSGGSNGGITMMLLCVEHQRAITVVKNVSGEYKADVFLLALEALSDVHNH